MDLANSTDEGSLRKKPACMSKRVQAAIKNVYGSHKTFHPQFNGYVSYIPIKRSESAEMIPPGNLFVWLGN